MLRAQEADEIIVPAWPRLAADNVTAEALSSLVADQGGRMAVMSAEGDLFDAMTGRYGQAGQGANLDVFLKGHSGDLLLVDRKSREPERIENPALTIVVTIPPRVLEDIARQPVLRGRGLLARVLYSLPPDLVGYRRVLVDPVPGTVKQIYCQAVKSLTLSLSGRTDLRPLALTQEARALLAEYQAEIEPRLRSIGGDLAEVQDWASKLAGATVRIAGLLHIAGDLTMGWGTDIQEKTMARAIEFGRYFTAHAKAAFAQIGRDPLVDEALAVLAWIERTRPSRFTRREAHMSLSRSRFPKVTDLDPALDLLTTHGYVRRETTTESTGKRGRPPSPAFRVHPDLCHETTKTTEIKEVPSDLRQRPEHVCSTLLQEKSQKSRGAEG